jgi:hypothetical protein
MVHGLVGVVMLARLGDEGVRSSPAKLIVLGLLGGAIVNVVVAILALSHAATKIPPWKEVGSAMRATYWGVSREVRRKPVGDGEPLVTVTTHAGWPVPALVKRSVYPERGPQTPGMIEIRPFYATADEIMSRPWQYRPALPGFIINSALFGLFLVLAALLWHSAWRHRGAPDAQLEQGHD